MFVRPMAASNSYGARAEERKEKNGHRSSTKEEEERRGRATRRKEKKKRALRAGEKGEMDRVLQDLKRRWFGTFRIVVA